MVSIKIFPTGLSSLNKEAFNNVVPAISIGLVYLIAFSVISLSQSDIECRD
jgi:hypothetical protein